MTRTGKNESIHPRVINGCTNFKTRNTCVPKRSQKVLDRLRTNMQEHLERHPRDNATRKHLEKL